MLLRVYFAVFKYIVIFDKDEPNIDNRTRKTVTKGELYERTVGEINCNHVEIRERIHACMGDDREEDKNNVRRRGIVKDKVASKFFLEFTVKEGIYPKKKIGETFKHAPQKFRSFEILFLLNRCCIHSLFHDIRISLMSVLLLLSHQLHNSE